MQKEIVNLYINGLPWCKASYPSNIFWNAKKDGIELSCSMEKHKAEKAIEWLKENGYNAYMRTGEYRSSLCEVDYIDGDDSYYDDVKIDERWFP
jgi:hypothetical protein